MKWYQKGWGIVLLLIIFFPIGIYLMWRYAKWNKLVKGVITGILALMVIASVSTPEQDSSTPDNAIADATAAVQATFTPEPLDTQTPPTEKPPESPSPTPEPTSSPTEKPTPTPTPTETPTPEPMPTDTPTPESTPADTPTPEPAASPTEAPQVNAADTTGNNGNGNSDESGNGSNFNTYDNTEQRNTEDTWVLNTSSKKIHYPSCKSVPKIAPNNYATSSESLDDLKAKGYTTCGNCF